jgi:hypothetical protein
MLAPPKYLILASTLLAAALAAIATEDSHSVVRPVAPTAVVKCPGVTSIPFTADPEQALPLRIVGSLGCGDTVAVLSDSEGYTARIRTADGKEGFVARMYLLTAASATSAAVKTHVSEATPANGIVRWQAGAPGCDEFLSHGRHVESITANGITVQVSLQDTGWKFRANVAVSNQGASAADVWPGIITLDELQPNLRTLPATNIQKIASTSTHRVLWTMATASPSPSAVTLQAGRTSEAGRLAYRTAPAPDYLGTRMTLTSDRPSAFARSESIDIASIALKPVTLSSGQKTAGVIWFTRDASARELSMRVPVGDMIFDFAFSFDPRK